MTEGLADSRDDWGAERLPWCERCYEAQSELSVCQDCSDAADASCPDPTLHEYDGAGLRQELEHPKLWDRVTGDGPFIRVGEMKEGGQHAYYSGKSTEGIGQSYFRAWPETMGSNPPNPTMTMRFNPITEKEDSFWTPLAEEVKDRFALGFVAGACSLFALASTAMLIAWAVVQ